MEYTSQNEVSQVSTVLNTYQNTNTDDNIEVSEDLIDESVLHTKSDDAESVTLSTLVYFSDPDIIQGMPTDIKALLGHYTSLYSASSKQIKQFSYIFEFEGHPTVYQKIASDIHGSGHNCTSEFNCITTQGFNIVSVLFNWSIRAMLQRDDPFFSYRQSWKLTYNNFNTAHKTIAKTMGIDPTNFSTHSSRIGGACTLAAAGFPDSFIMAAGGWSSLAFLYYIRLAIAQYQRGLQALSNPDIFTIRDVRRLLHGHITNDNRSFRKKTFSLHS